MNLQRIGQVLVASAVTATIAVTAGLLTGPTVRGYVHPDPPKVVAGAYVTFRPPHDKLTDWEKPGTDLGIPVPGDWKLLVKRIMDVRPGIEDKYFGVAVVGQDSRCLALISRFHNQQTMKQAWMFSRYKDVFSLKTPRPLSGDEFTTWLFTWSLECNWRAR